MNKHEERGGYFATDLDPYLRATGINEISLELLPEFILRLAILRSTWPDSVDETVWEVAQRYRARTGDGRGEIDFSIPNIPNHDEWRNQVWAKAEREGTEQAYAILKDFFLSSTMKEEV